MKLIIRADDYGYTKEYNRGTIETIRNGVVTSVDLMLDTPGTEDAIERIKEFPWISIGWHAHFWGKPVCDPSEIPSMVDDDGNFHFGRNIEKAKLVTYEDALKEGRAEIEKCIALLGRAPDTTTIKGDYPLEKARMQVCDEYGIHYNFAKKYNGDTIAFPDETYKHLNIVMPDQKKTGYAPMYSDSIKERKTYDPVNYYINDLDHILAQEIVITAWHPGYLDDYILRESSFNVARVKDVEALCSEELKQWLITHNVELINHRDALLGTQEYQNHLKAVGSELYCLK